MKGKWRPRLTTVETEETAGLKGPAACPEQLPTGRSFLCGRMVKYSCGKGYTTLEYTRNHRIAEFRELFLSKSKMF